MIKKKYFKLIGITTLATMLVFGMVACMKKNNTEILSYAPVYGSLTELTNIQSESPKPFINAGKIYKYLNYTFQIDNGEGIHVINSTDPLNPQKISFIKVKGCSEISIKNNILYTDNHVDLVGIDISNINTIQVVSRLEKVFPGVNQEYPPIEGIFFECADPAKGVVIGWTQKMLTNPKCKR
ncbi:MAG TPA: hypothetical protein PKC41_03470 [Chitinophagaceae bacterium]|jgi:hypothetical protein|nr:hypothetical protein [Chitinophagaceae bacterium]